jgi:hypothetical protein
MNDHVTGTLIRAGVFDFHAAWAAEAVAELEEGGVELAAATRAGDGHGAILR